MTNPLEKLKGLELKANFTPPERQYFYKLRDELEVIVGGISIVELKKPSDVVRARKIRAKLEEILRFVQDRKMEADLPIDSKFKVVFGTFSPEIGGTYSFSGRKVKLLGYRTLFNGVDQFKVEYLDDPNGNRVPHKKGDIEWCDYAQEFYRLAEM